MDNHWLHLWWVIFPLIGFGFAFCGMWMRYQRQKATIELLRTYVAQGKDLPAELVKTLQPDGRRYGPYRDWQRAVLFGSLAIALGLVAYLHYDARPRQGLIVAVIVLTALSVNSVIAALLRKRDVT